jgi:protein TonB
MRIRQISALTLFPFLVACGSTGDTAVDGRHGSSSEATVISQDRPAHDLVALSIAALKLQREYDAERQGKGAAKYRFAKYEEDWRLKVERIGTENYPAHAQGLSGSVRLTVQIRADGTVDSIVVERSSGYAALDQAAIDIVRLASPFAAFPPELARDIDTLILTRTWFFGSQRNVESK